MIGAAKLEAYTEKVNGHRRKGKSNNKSSCSNGSLIQFVNGGHFAIVFLRDNDRLVRLDSTVSVQTNRLIMISLRCRRHRYNQFIHFLNATNASRKRTAEHRVKVQQQKRQHKMPRYGSFRCSFLFIFTALY